MLKRLTSVTIILTLAFTFGLVTLPDPADAAGEMLIGIFDLQKAINNSSKGKAAKSKLVSKFERLQKDLKAEESRLQRMQADLEKQASVLSPDAKFEKEKELRRRIRDFQDKYRDYTEEMKREELNFTKPILDNALAIARSIGKERGYALILETKQGGVVYAANAIDITDEVIKRLDRGK